MASEHLGVEVLPRRIYELDEACAGWIRRLEHYPGWSEWNREKVLSSLAEVDGMVAPGSNRERQFVFSEEIGIQHDVVFQYLCLQQTVSSLKDCEFYFRRFPFRGLPVSHSDHITNVCEMYFGRFYELRERLRKYLNALLAVAPASGIAPGRFLKAFDKEFDAELRARNLVHHTRRFEDAGIDQIFVAHLMGQSRTELGWELERQQVYRRVSREWAARVRRRPAALEPFMVQIADTTLMHCRFLTEQSVHLD